MGEEKNAKWYDDAYATRPVSYYENPQDYWYAPLWDAILDNVEPTESIGDFGCGVGQFAKMCELREKYYARGVDFSKTAIEIARSMNPNKDFVVDTILNPNAFDFDFDVAVFCETMEHIEEDIKVLSHVPSKKKVIITLPTYDYRSHVRHITNEKQLLRYKKLMSYIKTELIHLHNGQKENGERDVYMIVGVRK